MTEPFNLDFFKRLIGKTVYICGVHQMLGVILGVDEKTRLVHMRGPVFPELEVYLSIDSTSINDVIIGPANDILQWYSLAYELSPKGLRRLRGELKILEQRKNGKE